MILSIIAWLVLQSGIIAVGQSSTAQSTAVGSPTNLLFYVVAFVVGYREDVFRSLIKKVADVILAPGGDGSSSSNAPTVSAIDPPQGTIAGGATVKVTGKGLAATTGVNFGSNAVSSVTVVSDNEVDVTTPSGSVGPVHVVITSNAGSIVAGTYTYQ